MNSTRPAHDRRRARSPSAAPALSFLPMSTRLAPIEPSARAAARPIPDVAPVMTHVLVSIDAMGDSSISDYGCA